MSLTLHGHHVLLIATLAFVAAVLTQNWYSNPNKGIDIDVFQICKNWSTSQNCQWIFFLQSNNSFPEITTIVYPILITSFAIACVGISLIGLLLGSWYIEQYARENSSKWLLVLTILAALFSFLFSCGVWTIMLTINLHQNIPGSSDIYLKDFGFSFWINIGSSIVYLYAFLIYLSMICING